MDLRELSLKSTEPIPSIPYQRYQIRLLSGVSPEAQGKELGKIASNLKRKRKEAIVAHHSSFSILSPIPINSIDNAEIIGQEEIDLASGEYERCFLEVCNFYLTKAFQTAQSKPRVDFYKKRIYSNDKFDLSKEGDKSVENNNNKFEIIEGQRYLNFDFSIDKNRYLILALDFGSEYHSRNTLDQLNLESLKEGQKLIHTYDYKSCELLGIADYSISTPLKELNNNSIIQYHQQKENLPKTLPNDFDSSCQAIKVRYSKNKGAHSFEAAHAPQLLRKLYDRNQVDDDEFHNYLWPIETKVEKAIETIKFLNKDSKFKIFNSSVNFSTHLLKPPNRKQVNTKARKNNLYFGKKTKKDGSQEERVVSFPSKALNEFYLLEKPSSPVQAVVLYPSSMASQARKYSEHLKTELERFSIELKRAYQSYNLDSPIEIRQACRELKECDIVIALVPQEANYAESEDPYKLIKRQLVRRKIPSQMITIPMLERGWNKNVGQNLILGINAKLGYTNWCIHSMPGETDLFIGLDISRKKGVTVGGSSFVFHSNGQLIEWAATEFQAYQETFNSEKLENLILDLYSKRSVKRLVIHRDGKLQDAEFKIFKKLEDSLRQEGLISLDVIEVIKSGICRAVACDSTSGGVLYSNPPRGWVWEHGHDEAVVLTTGSREAKVSKNSSPRPLRIRKRIGDTDLLILAEQVYWLSEMQVGSTQTIRLPITTQYADQGAESAQEGLLPLGVQEDRRLWFL